VEELLELEVVQVVVCLSLTVSGRVPEGLGPTVDLAPLLPLKWEAVPQQQEGLEVGQYE